MRLVSRAELLTLPVGTIYYNFYLQGRDPDGPYRFNGLGGETDGNFQTQQVGPILHFAGYNDEFPSRHVEITGDIHYEGMRDPDQRFIVLDADDVALLIRQLSGQQLGADEARRLAVPDVRTAARTR